MADLPLYDKDGKSTGTVSVDEKIFGEKIRKRLLHQVVVIYEANRREGNAHTKLRNEVRGSNKKLWPQKHTGRARMGTRRSPVWVGGGVVFGPRKKEYRQGITASMRRAALDSALLGKIRDKQVRIIEGVELEKPRTKQVAGLLKAMGVDRTALLAVPKSDRKLTLSARNLKALKVCAVSQLNAYEVLKYRDLVLTRESLDRLVAARSAKGATS